METPPMLFLRIGWMRYYEGKSDEDKIHGGGAFVREHGYGHEMFNFLPFNGRYYGYVRPTSGGSADNAYVDGAGIKLERLGAAKSDLVLGGALVVWVSSPASGGSFVIGWYRNAAVNRTHQPAPAESNRVYQAETFGYYASAAENDVTLLPITERVFEVPRGKGYFGQSNVWYADDAEHGLKFRREVVQFIDRREIPKLPNPSPKVQPRQPDPMLRSRVEQAAVQVTSGYFQERGYIVDSREKDNLGWDLDATCGKRELKLEVKGLSGNELSVELTPNEYAQMRKWQDSYCVCVVTNALTRPQLAVFAFSPESGQWQDEQKRCLQISEIVAARCRLS